MTVQVLPQAWKEAVEAAAWYDRKRSGLGDDFLEEVNQSLARIEQNPQSFPRWESYTGHREIRCCRLDRFPYAVIFALAIMKLSSSQSVTHGDTHFTGSLDWADSRVAGWSARVTERGENNRLIRSRSNNTGSYDRRFLPKARADQRY